MIDIASTTWSTLWSGIGAVPLLAAARLMGLAMTLPVLSSRILPFRFRLAVSVLLAFALLQGLPPAPAVPPVSLALLPTILGEAVIGAAIGAASLLVIAAVRSAATLIGEQTGFAFGGFLDPYADAGDSVLKLLYGGLATFTLLAVEVHHEILRAVADSFQIIAPGQLTADGLAAGLGRITLMVGALLLQAVPILVLPVSAVLLLASVAQGFLSRLFPELETVVFGFLLRTLVALGVVALSLPFFVDTCARFFDAAVSESRLSVQGFVN